MSKLHYVSTIKVAVLSVVVPKSKYQAFGQIFTALSMLAIIKHVALVGFAPVFSIMIDVYDNFIKSTVGFLDPLIHAMIDYLRAHFSIHIPFVVGWRHIFIVLQMLFVRDAMIAYSDGRMLLAAIRVFVGTVISLLCSIAIFISAGYTSFISNIIFCAIPVFGLLLYDLLMYAFSAALFFDAVRKGKVNNSISRSGFFIQGARRSFFRAFIVYMPSLCVIFIPSILVMPFPQGGVVGVFAGILANGFYWLLHGRSYALAQQKIGIPLKEGFFSSEAGRFGIAIFGVIFWLAVFLFINAGSRLLEL